jgi:tRNA G10  N-methylase Trm11|tara:strand:+ start:218 stop:610 length:393 start_codon:yes stop_codon:yes gene_type:complete
MKTFNGIWPDLYNFKIETRMEKIMSYSFETPEPSRRYVKTTRSVKAIIRYNHLDRKQVVYYKQGDRFFKLLDSMTIRPMAKSMMNIHSIAKHWSTKSKIEVVEYDEQLMFNGEVLDIPMDTFNINDSLKG